MTSKEILQASFLDLVFEGRNKYYGAYVLRRHYNSRLQVALATALGVVFLLLFLIMPATHRHQTPSNVYNVRTLQATALQPRVERPAPANAIARPIVAQAKFLNNIKMVTATDRLNALLPVTELENSYIGIMNVTRPDATELVPIAVAKSFVGTQGNVVATNEAFLPVEKQPEFPGGAAAWARFLNRHLQAPAALMPGEKVVVQVGFWVDTTGAVTDLSVMQSGGAVFDRAVISALQKMPRWNPAIQNGRSVAVRFTQPVTFVGSER